MSSSVEAAVTSGPRPPLVLGFLGSILERYMFISIDRLDNQRQAGRAQPAIPRLNEDPRSCVDTGGQVDSGVVDDSPWIFVRSGTRRTDSGRAGWPCGAPGGAAGERDCSFERRLELRGGRVGAFAGRRHGARVVRGLSETGHGGIEEFRP